MTLKEQSQQVKNIAFELGFDACGIAPARFLEQDANRLETWLSAGYQADMHWMENHFEKRTDPSKLVEGAMSVIVVLQNYFPENNPFENSKLKISRYALGVDYHTVIKDKLHAFFQQISNQITPIEGRCFVDSAPVLERSWAREAGLGWIGKNSLLLTKTGSYFFIGVLIVDAKFDYDTPMENHCGNCRICLDACPTQAIVSSGVVDSNRCISYQTIENKGEIPDTIAESMNGRIFGCDICQEVCPWNKKAMPHNEPNFEPSEQLIQFAKNPSSPITEEEFSNIFRKSAVKRAKYSGLLRNINATQPQP